MNFQIIIRRNSIWIKPYSLWNHKLKIGSCKSLDKSLSAYDLGKNIYYLGLDIYDKDTSTFKIPIGYGLSKILNHLNSKNNDNNTDGMENTVEIIDKRDDFVKPINISFNMNPKFGIKDKIQADAINFLLTVNHHSKLLTLGTGYGKTFCAVYTVWKRGVPAVVLSANLSEQWIQRIQDYTDIDPDLIVNLRGTKALYNILESEPNKKVPFYIISTATMNNFIKSGGNCNELFQKMGIGIKIFDEAHTFYSQNAKIDVNSDTRETIYLTATPQRSSRDEHKIFNRIFNDIPMHGEYTHYINTHYIIRVVNYNTFPTSMQVQNCMIYYKKFFSVALYSNYIFRDKEKSTFYCGMIKMLIDQLMARESKMKILVIMPVLEHLSILKKFLISTSPGYSVGEYTSNIPIKIREEELNNDVILSTLKSFKEGRDVKGLKAIFSLVTFSSSLIAQQLLGRLREIKDENTYFYDFADLGFPRMIEQREWRKKELVSRNRFIQKRNVSKEEVFEYLRDYYATHL